MATRSIPACVTILHDPGTESWTLHCTQCNASWEVLNNPSLQLATQGHPNFCAGPLEESDSATTSRFIQIA